MKRKLLRPLILWSGIAVVSACATTNETSGLTDTMSNGVEVDARKMIDNAYTLIDEQRYDQAQDGFARILKILPANEDAQAGLAYAARRSGKLAEALKQYEQLGRNPSHRTKALVGRGISLVQLQRWTEAEGVLLSALEHDATSWGAWNALGQVRDHQNRWSDAEIAYFNAISLRPLAPSLYNNLGVSYLCQLRFDEAIEQFNRSLKLNGGARTVAANRVIALAMKGDYVMAVESIPVSDRPYGLNNIGYVALLNGDKTQARAFLERAGEANPRFHQKAAENLERLGD